MKIRRSFDGRFIVYDEAGAYERFDSLKDVRILGKAVYVWKGSRV